MKEHSQLGIVELIDRTLNKGVILNADLVITVADIPLLAANIRLALASVETMLKYGMMNDLLAVQPLSKLKVEREILKPISINEVSPLSAIKTGSSLDLENCSD